MSDFRSRCAELVAAMDSYPVRPKAHRDLCNRVRDELKREPPTDEEIDQFAAFWWGPVRAADTLGDLVQAGVMSEFARAVLSYWGGI